MRQIVVAAFLMALAGAVGFSTQAAAQSSSTGIKLAQADLPDARPRPRRPSSRLRVTPYPEQGVIPHYNPGPNAKRVCDAHYEQEFRPSGTVIVPRMRCYWTRG